jgi:hypothetical protein
MNLAVHSINAQEISTILIDELPMFDVLRTVYIMLVSEFSRLYHLVVHVLQMKRHD